MRRTTQEKKARCDDLLPESSRETKNKSKTLLNKRTMASVSGVRSTMSCLRKVRVTIPRLSPTHTRARIIKFCPSVPGLSRETETETTAAAAVVPTNNTNTNTNPSSVYLECTDPLFVLECSSDIVTEGFREQIPDGDGSDDDVQRPLMIVETHDEGDFALTTTAAVPAIRLGEWYDVGETIGVIDDGDEDDSGDDDEEEWLWQAYSYEENQEGRELNLPPHIATGKITN